MCAFAYHQQVLKISQRNFHPPLRRRNHPFAGCHPQLYQLTAVFRKICKVFFSFTDLLCTRSHLLYIDTVGHLNLDETNRDDVLAPREKFCELSRIPCRHKSSTPFSTVKTDRKSDNALRRYRIFPVSGYITQYYNPKFGNPNIWLSRSQKIDPDETPQGERTGQA